MRSKGVTIVCSTSEQLPNTYFICLESANEAVIIDVGFHLEWCRQQIAKYQTRLVGILLTHGHLSHVARAAELSETSGKVSVYLARDDLHLVQMLPSFADSQGYCGVKSPRVSILMDQGGQFTLGSSLVVNYHLTPGHTPGSCCFKIEKNHFVGDLWDREKHCYGEAKAWNHEVQRLSSSTYQALLNKGDRVHPGHGSSWQLDS
ncbi:MAG: MBL fold metallo-hydrolase [Bdellovibrionales bacterium]|nr:MBL fold metallo-hydrolase [Bdellovibrionales bacterium]